MRRRNIVAQFKNTDSSSRKTKLSANPTSTNDPEPFGNCPAELRRFPAKWMPVRVKKNVSQQGIKSPLRFDFNGNDSIRASPVNYLRASNGRPRTRPDCGHGNILPSLDIPRPSLTGGRVVYAYVVGQRRSQRRAPWDSSPLEGNNTARGSNCAGQHYPATPPSR